MRVHDLMTHEVWTCAPDDDLARAGAVMSTVGCGAVPICSGDGKLVGILTDRDVCLFLTATDRRASEVLVAEVMKGEVWSCQEGDSVRDALATMRRHQVRRLPVLDDERKLVGIVSLDDMAAEARAGSDPFDAPVESEVARTLRAVSHPLPYRRPVP